MYKFYGMKKLCTLLFLLSPFFFALTAAAQPSNDECSTPFVLSNISNWCSSTAAYSNAGATLSGNIPQPNCFPDVTHDVWFSFVAIATTLQVTVIGNTPGPSSSGGSMVTPQFAIYTGACAANNLAEVACASDGFGNNIVETFAGPLQVGQTYFIRVDARNGATGTFQLCVNNFNAVPDPSGDCPTGPVLCDKSSFTVESLVGVGNLDNEFDPGICIQAEFASAWYRWTCKDAGTLSFTITPTNPSDDIDFAIFELPGGLDDCANKVKIRCEAAGENVGQPFSNWEICTGPTGLSISETDTDEFPGCAPGQNNFVSAIQMVPGVSYALIINNYSNTGNGFSIEFGGSGTFLGPEAAFTVAPSQTVCLNEALTFTDASSSPEGIVKWEWNFGPGASPATATGPGPHNVTYSTPGLKSVVLSVTSDAGCIVTDIQTVDVLPLPEATPTVITDYCGPDDQTGGIYLSVSGGTPPYLFNWQDSGVFLPDTSLINAETGTYHVVVQDSNGCVQDYNIVVPEGLSLEAGVNPVMPPTCNSGSDGSISISIAIANYPIQYDFGNGLQADSFLTNIPAGTYDVYVVDAAGCDANFTIVVVDYPPLLTGMDPIDISCFGEQDGSITAMPSGGAGAYTYLWNNGSTEPTISNLAQGTYTVTVTDAAGCTSTADAAIIEPPELLLTLAVTNVVCHGNNSGIITASATGGTPPYEYSADGVNFQTSPNLSGLFAGTYDAIVRDSRGCLLTAQATVTEPPPLLVDAGEDQTIDLGYTADIRALITPLFHPVTITWTPSQTLDCNDCPGPAALPASTTTYYITVVDADGCSATDSVTIIVILNRPIYIPNAFSPNNDGVNDFFTVYGGPAARSVRKLKIFDRWGELVFDGANLPLNNEPSGWNGFFKGKEMDPAVFAYLAEVEFIDGVVVLYEGDVTIIR